MRHILVSASVLLIVISTYGQSDKAPPPCTLKLSQAPAVRGVKLGMSVDDLLALFPGSSEILSETLKAAEGYPNFGFTTFAVTPSRYTTKDRFAGIQNYYVRSFDRRVVGLDVTYSTFPMGARWRNIDDLVQRFSDSLQLPKPKDWAKTETYPQEKLKCDGFEIEVSAANDRAVIGFNERSWEQTPKDRLAAFEEEKRREFKP